MSEVEKMGYVNGLVTLIIPCYNGEQYIKQCFQSVLAQNYKQLEVIFVDDGSTDESYKYALSYQALFKKEGMNLVCLTKENGGAASAVQMAFQYMSGEYFELLDVDDCIYPDNIKTKYQYMRDNPDCAFVRSEGEIFNIQKNCIVSVFSVRKEERRKYNIFEELLYGKTWNWTGSYLIRTDKFLQVNGGKDIYISKYGQNMQILLPLAFSFECSYIPDILSRYNEYDNSISHVKAYEKNIELFEGYQDIRINVLKKIKFDNAEIMNNIKQYYIKKKLYLALEINNKEEINRYYKDIKKTPKIIILVLCSKIPILKRLYLKIAQLLKK